MNANNSPSDVDPAGRANRLLFQQEIDSTISKFENALVNRNWTVARGLLLYLNLLIQNSLNDERSLNFDGAIQAIAGCINKQVTAVNRDFIVELFCFLKHLALLQFVRCLKSQGPVHKFDDSEKDFKHGISQFENILGADLRRKMCLKNLRGLYALHTCGIFFQVMYHFSEQLKDTTLNVRSVVEISATLVKAITGDPQSIALIIDKGFTVIRDHVRKHLQSQRQSFIITVESFNYFVLADKNISVERAAILVGQVTTEFNRKIKDINHTTDWVGLYGITDCLMNIVVRFNDPANKDHALMQQHIIKFFVAQLPFSCTGPFYRMGNGQKLVATNLESRMLECVALIGLYSNFETVKSDAQSVFIDLRCNQQNLIRHSNLLEKLGRQGIPVYEECSIVPMLVQQWLATINQIADIIIERESLLIETFWRQCAEDPSVSISVRTFHRLIDHMIKEYGELQNLAVQSTLYVQDDFFYCVCLRLMAICVIRMESTPKDEGKLKDSTPQQATLEIEDIQIKDVKLVEVSQLQLEPLVEELLTRPTNSIKLTIDESITCIRSIIAVGRERMSHYRDDDVLIVLGPTGAGKSTTINWLYGCKMINEYGMPFVDPQSEKMEVAPIGKDSIKSLTVIPGFVRLEDTSAKSLVLCDAPGFLESRGPEISIGNAVNIVNVVRQCSQCRMLLLLGSHDFRSSKGDAVKKSLEALVNLFGGRENFDAVTSSIIVGVTQVPNPKVEKDANDVMKALCNEFNYHIRLPLVTIDPLQILPGVPTRREVMDAIGATLQLEHTKISSILKPPVDSSELDLLREISRCLAERCRDSWENKRYQELADNFALLHELTKVGEIQFLSDCEALLAENIIEWIQSYINEELLELFKMDPPVRQMYVFRWDLKIQSLQDLVKVLPSTSQNVMAEVKQSFVNLLDLS